MRSRCQRQLAQANLSRLVIATDCSRRQRCPNPAHWIACGTVGATCRAMGAICRDSFKSLATSSSSFRFVCAPLEFSQFDSYYFAPLKLFRRQLAAALLRTRRIPSGAIERRARAREEEKRTEEDEAQDASTFSRAKLNSIGFRRRRRRSIRFGGERGQ